MLAPPLSTTARAQDATWIGPDFNWNIGSNWSGGAVPDGIATFTTANPTSIAVNGTNTVGALLFDAGAVQYGFTLGLGTFTLNGAGIVNNSTFTPDLTVTATGGLDFSNMATAGNANIISSGITNFYDSSTAGSATFLNNAGGLLIFRDLSTAGTATVTNNGQMRFDGDSSASMAIITNNASLDFFDNSTVGVSSIDNFGTMTFSGNSNAGSNFILNQGDIYFFNDSSAFNTTITNNIFIEFQQNSTAGNATIDNMATGELNFRDNARAGSSTITNASQLQFFGNSSADNATIINNWNTFFFDSSTAGNANITNNVNGVLTFNGDSTAGNATITNNAEMRFLGGASAGTATITNNSELRFQDASTAGTAMITNNSFSSILVFENQSNAGSATIENSGGAYFMNGSNAGTASITNIANTSLLEFRNTSTAGNATITNDHSAASVFFFDDSTAGNAVIINRGAIEFSDQSKAGTALITNDGTVRFSADSNAENARITNNLNLYFQDNSTAGNATITNNSELLFVGQSSGGSAQITNNLFTIFQINSTAGSAAITNNSNLVFENSSTAGNATIVNSGGANLIFLNNSNGGNAAITNDAFGIVTFAGSAGPNNDGRLTVGSIAGAGQFMLGNRQLTVGGNNLSTTVSGLIEGNGGVLVKTGTGTLTLSGTNTYTGATFVDGGTLMVNGSIATSAFTAVNTGATLGGTGVVGSTSVNNGGTLAPGNSIGTITVSGPLAFSAGSTYAVEISPQASDLVRATGDVAINGGTVSVTPQAGTYVAKRYVIVNSGTLVNGTFDTLSYTAGAFGRLVTNPRLSYDAQNVYLVFDPVALSTILPPGLGQNQKNVTAGIERFYLAGGDITNVVGLFSGQIGNNLSQATGQTATGAQTAVTQSSNGFFTLMLDVMGRGAFGAGFAGPAGTSGQDALASAVPGSDMPWLARRWNVWGMGYGGTNRIDGDAAVGSQRTTSRAYGFAVGADYRFGPDVLAGFALAGGGNNWTVDNGLGSGRADAFQAGAYAAVRSGGFYLSGALAYTQQWAQTDRTVTIGAVENLRADFDPRSIGARIEGGYRFGTPQFGVTPYGAAQAQWIHLPAYAEQTLFGPGVFALSYGSQNVTARRTELGARFDGVMAQNATARLVMRARAAWVHDFGSNPRATATFQTLPGASFTVDGAAAPPNAALVSAGTELQMLNGWSLGTRFDAELSSGAYTYAGSGTVRYTW